MKNNYTFFNLKSKNHALSGSSSFFKSLILTLAIFISGIGSVSGQCTSTFTTMLPTTVQNPGATITTNTAKYFAVNVTAGTFYRITSTLQDGCFNIRMGSATGTVIWSARSGSMFRAPSTGVAYVHHSTGACATSTSTVSRTITFITQTTCTSTAFSSPWNEGFEGLTTAAYGVSAILPCGWAKAGQTGTLNAASISYNDPRTGSNYLTTYYPSTTNTDFIWTRGFDLIAGTSYNFSFYFAGDGTAGWQGDVYTGLNQNAAAATILGSSFVSSATTTTSSYQQVTRTFTPASTGTYYFAIRSQRSSSSPWYLGFDDFSLVDITPTCPTLSSPADAASGVSQLPTLSWTAGANSNSYDVYLSTNQTDVNNQAVGALVSSSQAGVTYSPTSLTASTNYYWRVVPKNSLGNAASGCTTRSFTTQASTPTLTVGSLTAFGNQCVNTTSAASSFTVSGINLTGNVDIAALSGYTYCATVGGTYTSTLSIPASGSLASTNVYVKFSPTAASTYSGNIVVSSTGATSADVAASGTGINTTISTQPSSATATYCPSAAATALTVAATAASGSAFSYQWYSNSSASTSGGTVVGTNAASYTPSTAVNGTLYYYCVVSGCGTSTATSTVTGAITTGACINMSTGSTTLTGNANFYDSQGSGANYLSNESFTYTVYPISCNNVRVTFASFATEANYDYLYVYNGNSTAAAQVAGSPFNGATLPAAITSSAADGSLTFRFTSDVSGVAAGWAATLSNIPVSTGPAAPTGFAGTLDAEVGSTQTYSVTAVAGATYSWSFPSGWVINSGQGTNSVSVTVGSVNGNISVTPTYCSLAGTAYTVATTIPNYRWKYVSSNLGSATWTGGEARSIDITIKNTGVATWNTTYPNNIGVRWNSTTGSLSGTPWSDYHVRASVGSLAPGATGTFTLAMEARNSDNASTPSLTTNLADGTYYLAFDMVSEAQCWFSNNTGTCGPGNTVFYSAVQTVSTVPTLSCSALTAFGSVCSDATATNSFTISGVNLTNNVSVGALTGYTYSTTSNGTYTSTLTLTPSSGSLNQIVYVKFTPTAAQAYSGSIVVSSTGATPQNVAASGTGIQATTVNAGSDFNLCSGQTVALNGSTNATSSSGSASSGTVTASGTDNTNPTGTYTFTGLPAGALINGITVNVTSAGGVNCPSYYSVTTRINGVQQGAAGCAVSTAYTNFNGQAANGLVIAVRGQDNDAYGDAMTITYTVSLNYTVPPTYSWSPATALSATNVLNPNCSATTTTTYTLTVTGTNGCSASDAVAVTVAGAAPSAPTASVSGSSTINVGGTTTLTSSAGANTLWYTAASGGSSVGSGDNWQTPVQCVAGTATYYAEDNNGTCASTSRTAVSFTVRSMVVSNPANGLICQAGGSVTLSAQLTGGSSISWSPNTNLSTTSGASTVASPTTTTPYTMSATVTGCGSVSDTQTVGVIDAVAFTPTSTPTAVCAGNPAVLASNLSSSNFSVSSTTYAPITEPGAGVTTLATGGAASVALSGGDLDDGGWSNIPIGFTYNFFGSNYTTLAVGTNGVLMFGTVPGYATTSGQLGQYSYSENASNCTPVGASSGQVFPNCNNPANIIALMANDLQLDGGSIKYWKTGIAPTQKFVVQFSGVPHYSSSGVSASTVTVQCILFETTGNVEIHIASASVGTGNNAKTVGLQDATRTIGATAPNRRAFTTAITTPEAWKFVPGVNYTFQWATAGSNISGAESTTYTTPALSTPGTVSYTVAATNPNTQCASTGTVSITVNALPSAPVSAGNVTECANAANQNLVVSVGAGVTADWYAASSTGAVLTTPSNGTSTTSYSVPANATATYYAEARNTTTGCVSSSRTGVTFTTKPVPTAPTASAVSYCQGATSSPMTASTPVGSNTQNWYDVSTGGTPLAGAPTPSTSTATTLTYYVSEVGTNGCESSRTSVTATINASPATPTGISASRCGTGTVSLGVETSINGTINWYSDAGLTNLLDSYANCTTPNPCTTNWTTPSISSTTVYYATKTNVAGCQSLGVAVTATVNPDITASVSNSASSTSACGGGSITFTATPTNGGASPSYQWYLNGATVGTNSTTYELASPANNDQIYVAMTPSAQNCLTSASATNSSTITLTSSASTPTVSIQSSAIAAICPGTSVTFSVNTSANMGATPSYVWKLNGSAISGATNATYTSTDLVNNDQITLEMTSSLNGLCVTQPSATSSAITTTVNTATSITAQPSATSACASGTANFTVTGAGQGVLTYQWKKNAVDITGNGTATSSSLTLSGVGAGDVADYTVVVTGACGSVTSNTAAFTLNTPTSISVHPAAVTTCTNTDTNFSVTAAGQGTLSYQWTYNGTPITNATSSTYTATGVTSANAGNYRVNVTGGCGTLASNQAALTVQPATVIATQPSASTICQNNTANFSVSATGQGTLSYQWKKDGTNVGTNSSSLSVSNAQSANAGTYTVEVSGTCGTATSNGVSLTVNPATSITTQASATPGCEGQTTTFSVVAAGTAPLSYQWKFGSTNITNATSSTYNLPNSSSADDGSYSVVVTGGCGIVNSNTVSLIVYPTPTANAGNDFTACPGQSITLTGSGVTGGTYTWNNSVTNNTPFSAPGTTTTYTVTGTSAQGCSDEDDILVTILPTFSAGAINTTGETICNNGDPVNITSSSAASGGDASITYKWQANGVDIANTNSATYNPPAGLTATTTYTRLAKDGTCNSFTQSTGSWVVTVRPTPTASLSGTETVCQNGANPNLTFTNPQSLPVTVTYSVNGGGNQTVDIGASTSATVSQATGTAGVFTYSLVSVQYQAAPSCSNNISGTATVTVRATPSLTGSVQEPAYCDGVANTVTLSGLVPNSLFNVGYTIAAGAQQSGTATTSSNSGVATFQTIPLTMANNGQILQVNSLEYSTAPACPVNSFSQDFTILIRNAANNVNLVSSTTASAALQQCSDGRWTYYGTTSNPTDWIFGIDKNGNNFEATVDITVSNTVFSKLNTATPGFEHGSFLMPRYWNVNLVSGSITTTVGVRFFYNPTELSAAERARDSAWAPYSATASKTPLRWFKSVGVPFNAAVIAGIDGNSFNNFPNITLTPSTDTINGVTYAEFTGITSFSGGTAGYGFSSQGAGLPVKLTSFKAQAIDNSFIRLDWATAIEIDNSGFEIERSKDGINFTTIGWKDGNGNSTEPKYYGFDDKTVSTGTTYYYRLKQIDFDGQFEYSNIVSASLSGNNGTFDVLDFLPNPTVYMTTLLITSGIPQDIKVTIYNAIGQKVQTGNHTLNVGENKVEFDVSMLAAGTYMATVTSGNEIRTKRLVIGR